MQQQASYCAGPNAIGHLARVQEQLLSPGCLLLLLLEERAGAGQASSGGTPSRFSVEPCFCDLELRCCSRHRCEVHMIRTWVEVYARRLPPSRVTWLPAAAEAIVNNGTEEGHVTLALCLRKPNQVPASSAADYGVRATQDALHIIII